MLTSKAVKRILAVNKSTTRIPLTNCYRHQLRFAMNEDAKHQISQRHGWCEKFCREICMYSAVDNCVTEPEQFCVQNCQNECYHVGPVPTKK